MDRYLILFTLLAALATAVVSLFVHFSAKKEERRWKVFKEYHELIRMLSRGPGHENEKRETQTAVVFELRNFEKYKDVSLRLVKSKFEDWTKGKSEDQFDFLDKELLETIKFFEGK